MIQIGDRVFQICYDWGKYSNGEFKPFEVRKIYQSSILDCVDLSSKELVLYIPENTWMKIEDFRRNKIKKILGS